MSYDVNPPPGPGPVPLPVRPGPARTPTAPAVRPPEAKDEEGPGHARTMLFGRASPPAGGEQKEKDDAGPGPVRDPARTPTAPAVRPPEAKEGEGAAAGTKSPGG